MKIKNRTEGGQALILIVFGIIALVGIVALAVDGGNVYSDRRQAQNAADSAALAAALAYIRQPPGTLPADTWKQAGYSRAASNGYLQSGPNSTVVVYLCSDIGANCTLLIVAEPFTDVNGNGLYDFGEPFTDTNGNGEYDGPPDPTQYVKVTISSTIDTYFARVLGINQLANSVQATAKALPAVAQNYYHGSALVALQPDCKNPPTTPNDPFTLGGHGTVTIGGSGVFVNSNCDSPPKVAFTASNNTNLQSPGGTCVVGAASIGAGATIDLPVTHNCTQVDPQWYQLPNPSCSIPGVLTTVGTKNYVASPGNWPGDFPPKSVNAGTLKLEKGVYCINGSLSIGSNWTITTDTNGNGSVGQVPADNGEGVMFFLPNGGVTINGGAAVQVAAQEDPSIDITQKGYLIYLPPTNSSSVSIGGGGASRFVGTIMAPASYVSVSGNSSTDSATLQCQIVGYSLSIGGGGSVNIIYTPNLNARTWSNPFLQPFK